MTNTLLMQELLDAGYPIEEMDHHYSDLYVYVTPLTTNVINKWCAENNFRKELVCPVFKDNISGRKMYNCAFQYTPTVVARWKAKNAEVKNDC